MSLAPDTKLVVAGAVLVVAGAAYLLRNGGASIGRAPVQAVDGALGEAGNVLGDIVGLPRTDLDACERAIAEGRTWDASFACPAGRFIRYVTTGK